MNSCCHADYIDKQVLTEKCWNESPVPECLGRGIRAVTSRYRVLRETVSKTTNFRMSTQTTYFHWRIFPASMGTNSGLGGIASPHSLPGCRSLLPVWPARSRVQHILEALSASCWCSQEHNIPVMQVIVMKDPRPLRPKFFCVQSPSPWPLLLPLSRTPSRVERLLSKDQRVSRISSNPKLTGVALRQDMNPGTVCLLKSALASSMRCHYLHRPERSVFTVLLNYYRQGQELSCHRRRTSYWTCLGAVSSLGPGPWARRLRSLRELDP